MSFDATVSGTDLLSVLDADALDAAVTDALKDSAPLVAKGAARKAPRRTGKLADSHAVAVVAGPNLIVKATAPYAVYVHARRPWLRDYTTDTMPTIVDAVTKAVTDHLNG